MSDDKTEIEELRAQARALYRASAKNPVHVDGQTSAEFARVIAIGALRSGLAYMQARMEGRAPAPTTRPLQATGSEPEVMTADEVAAFLGVDRNTVYDYAGRGVIPHQRLGKRILFLRGALVSWLDASCKAASTRKG